MFVCSSVYVKPFGGCSGCLRQFGGYAGAVFGHTEFRTGSEIAHTLCGARTRFALHQHVKLACPQIISKSCTDTSDNLHIVDTCFRRFAHWMHIHARLASHIVMPIPPKCYFFSYVPTDIAKFRYVIPLYPLYIMFFFYCKNCNARFC